MWTPSAIFQPAYFNIIQGNFSRERPPGRVQFVKLSVKYLCVNLILLGIVSK